MEEQEERRISEGARVVSIFYSYCALTHPQANLERARKILKVSLNGTLLLYVFTPWLCAQIKRLCGNKSERWGKNKKKRQRTANLISDVVQRNHRERKKHILITGGPSEAKRDVHARKRDVEEAHFELFSQLSWINVARNDSLVQYVRELEKRKREKEKRRFSCCTLRFFCVFIPQLRLISLLKIACFPMRRQHGREVLCSSEE